jgi:two-component system, LytTR family, sensor kinase
MGQTILFDIPLKTQGIRQEFDETEICNNFNMQIPESIILHLNMPVPGRYMLMTVFQRRHIFHLLFWLMYVAFAILDMQDFITKKGWPVSLLPLSINCALTAMLVYVHTLVLIPLLSGKKKIGWYITGLVVLVTAYTLLRSRSQKYWDAVAWPDEPMKLSSYFKWNFFYADWFVLISTLLLFTQKWSEQRQQVKNIQINQLETELKYLRLQVNPHFLFNGLNTIYGYIDSDNIRARDMMVQFSDLLRYNLYEADIDSIALAREIDYLRNYVALQKARSNDNMQIDLEIAAQDPSVKIAPLLFMPFVENAFKHVSRDDRQVNRILISLRQTGDSIRFECRNSYDNGIPENNGIGLNNVIRRLELLYKDRYKLQIDKDASIYFVLLTINI